MCTSIQHIQRCIIVEVQLCIINIYVLGMIANQIK